MSKSEKNQLNSNCDQCSRLGLLSAELYKDSDTGERYIGIRVCENHTTSALAEKSVKALQKTNLRVEVVDA